MSVVTSAVELELKRQCARNFGFWYLSKKLPLDQEGLKYGLDRISSRPHHIHNSGGEH